MAVMLCPAIVHWTSFSPRPWHLIGFVDNFLGTSKPLNSFAWNVVKNRHSMFTYKILRSHHSSVCLHCLTESWHDTGLSDNAVVQQAMFRQVAVSPLTTWSDLEVSNRPSSLHFHWIPLTVKHILVECANLRDIREKYFTVISLADLFDRVDNHTVINFIKETHFYHQL